MGLFLVYHIGPIGNRVLMSIHLILHIFCWMTCLNMLDLVCAHIILPRLVIGVILHTLSLWINFMRDILRLAILLNFLIIMAFLSLCLMSMGHLFLCPLSRRMILFIFGMS